MPLETNSFYEFGDFRLDLAERVLLRGENFIPVTPKVFETLCVLIENAGRVIEKDELMQKIWQDRFVEESNLTFNIGMLRKALGDDAANPRYVETVPRRGYRFIHEVKRAANDSVQKNGDSKTHSLNGRSTNAQTAESNGANRSNGNSAAVKLIAEIPASKNFSASRPRLIPYSLAATAILLGIGAAWFFFGGQSFFGGKSVAVNSDSESLVIEKLTDAGNVNCVSISPDGRLLAYYTNETGKITVWLRQLATGKSIPIFTTDDDFITTLKFSPDGEYVYYAHSDENHQPSLSRLSILGGSPTRILRGVHGSFDFSPDGNQIVFARIDAAGNRLVIADALGNNEREVFIVPKPGIVMSLDWSPDGAAIAYVKGNGRFGGSAAGYEVLKLNLADRATSSLTDYEWNFIENAKWLPGGNGLLLTAQKRADDVKQIWQLTLPDGRVEQITNTSTELYLSGASADFSRIVATQGFLGAAIWIAPKTDASNFKMLAKSHWEMAWTPDNRIVFAAKDTARTTLWRMNADGSGKRQLTADETAAERAPAISADGKYVVFAPTVGKRQNIWRMNAADGGNRTRLTNGDGENYPVITPDGKSVVYNSNKDGSLWRISIDGGEPAQMFAEKMRRVALSPDGERFAHFGRRDGARKLFVKSFPGGELVQEFDAPSSNATAPRIVWTRDAQSLIYNDSDETLEIDNLWEQPLAVGGKRRQLTNFDAEWIYDFGFSPDDRRLAVVRGAMNYDAVLLKGFR